MGCGCKGGRKGTSVRRAPTSGGGVRLIRPTVGPTPAIGGVAAGPSPAQLRALNLPNNAAPVTPGRMDADKRRIERLRRAAIQKALNK
jgi:hypothetical protein